MECLSGNDRAWHAGSGPADSVPGAVPPVMTARILWSVYSTHGLTVGVVRLRDDAGRRSRGNESGGADRW